MKVHRHVQITIVSLLLVLTILNVPNTTEAIKLDNTPLALQPSIGAELTDSASTANFLRSLQNTAKYNASNIDQIYYRLAAYRILDPTLVDLPVDISNVFVSSILSFQNPDGGFGQWHRDTSGISSTKKAVEVLSWLGELGQINATLVGEYLNSIRNQLTSGFNSNKYDSDADIYTSTLGVESYDILGLSLTNKTDITNMFLRSQNNSTDPLLVPTIELGGFGKQTNNQKGIFWSSQATVSRAAVHSLQILATPFVSTDTVNFLKSLQTTNGGFVNDKLSISESSSYTSSALEAIYMLSSTPQDAVKAIGYIQSLETSDGGFKLTAGSVGSSMKATYYCLNSLSLLSSSPSNVTKTKEFLLNWLPTSGGYGGYPGEEATLRETFDAVSALNLMDRTPTSKSTIINYLESYRNPSGGFGLISSYVESTLRVLEVYNILGVAYPTPTETINFLQSLQQPDGGFSKGEGKAVSYVISTYRSVRALQLLNSAPLYPSKVSNYILSTYNASVGGFGGYYGDSPDVSSTYRALRTFKMLNYSQYDKLAISNFIKNSQNPDGGFKRSTYDITRPKNVSNAIFTYSAVKALSILDDVPKNVSGVYQYVTTLRNSDGGYSEHPQFTSDGSYTFTNIWILANLNKITGFKVQLDTDIITKGDTSLSIGVYGELVPIAYNITFQGVSLTGTLQSQGKVVLSFTNLPLGDYSVKIFAQDVSGQVIDGVLNFSVVDQLPDTSNPTSNNSVQPSNPNSFLGIDNMIPLVIGGVVLMFIAIFIVKSKK